MSMPWKLFSDPKYELDIIFLFAKKLLFSILRSLIRVTYVLQKKKNNY